MLVPQNRAEFLYPTFSMFIRGISTISFKLFSLIYISSLGTINCLLLSAVFLTLVLSAWIQYPIQTEKHSCQGKDLPAS